MSRTSITKPFNEWRGTSSTTNQYVLRSAIPSAGGLSLSVKVRIGQYDVFRSDATGTLYQGVSFSDAIRWADDYIIDNFQVQKTLEERLTDALERVEQLETRLKEREAA